MKAKILGFFCSLLVINFAYGQTIDGKLYTQFNNWYKWRGGGFDSTLLLPQDSAATGKRPGAVYYRSADSSVYSWTGTQWRKVSGSIPTLQQVTTAGNSTTDSIKIQKNGINILSLGFCCPGFGSDFFGQIRIGSTNSNAAQFFDTGGFTYQNNTGNTRIVSHGTITNNHTINFPDSGGVLTQRVKVNGTTYNTAANGVIDLGTISTDTSSLSTRINERVRYTDTAAMLAPYLRSASNGLTKSGQNVKLGGTLTENTTIDAKNYNITFDTVNNFKVNTKDYVPNITAIENGGVSMVDAYFRNLSNMGYAGIDVIGDSAYSQNFVKISAIKNTTRNTFLTAFADSLEIDQELGIISITNLDSTTDTTTHKPIVYDPTSKRMKYKTAWQNTDTATVVKAYVTNAEAVTITKGQVVYIFGASGDRAAVKLAKNTSDTFSSKTLGIVREDIAAGQAGWVTTQGQVSGINLGAYTAGDILWLDSVPGGFTKTKPVAPYHSVFVGVVERANAGNGLIYVKPQNGVELDELHNVKITSPKSGDAITYTASSDIWENRQVVLKQDTVPLAVFNVGSAAAGDTAAFSTSTLAGSFYLDGTDTMFVTSYRVALQGTSASITPEVWFNDSLNVTAGGTRLATGSAITNITTGTSVTPTTNKIPPANFVFVRFSAVTTKPTYFTLTLFGYRIRKQ